MPQLLPVRFASECIREFELAAEERYVDALQLADSGRRTGAIYLFGYVVEMELKAGFLRLAGHADDDPISIQTLWNYSGPRANTMARSLGLAGAKNLHDVEAWAELIVAYRSSRNRVYSERRFAARLLANVRAIAERWTEALRYHKNVAFAHELNAVRTACSWIVTHRKSI